MKFALGVLMFFCTIDILSAQSEYYESGESGFISYLEYSNARLRGFIKRKDHVTSLNLGYGWGGKGEFGFGIGLIDTEVYGNVHVGYNLYPHVKDYGVKLVSNFIVSRDQSFWERGISIFGNWGRKDEFVPSFSLLFEGNNPIGELRLAFTKHMVHSKILFIPTIRQSRGNAVFSVALGIVKRKNKKEITVNIN